MSEIRIVRDYAYPVTRVWRALTDSDLVPLWTATGAGGRPEGFAPVPGTRFRFVAKPKPGWNGIVNCEVIEAREPTLLRYTWTDDAGGDTTVVTYRLEPGRRRYPLHLRAHRVHRHRRPVHGPDAGPDPPQDAQ